MGKKPSPAAKPATASELLVGVYFNSRRETCIVYKVTHHQVHAVFMGPQITAGHMTVHAFTRAFTRRWPQYPLRRAARLYLRSHLQKDEPAAHVLRLLASSSAS